MITSSDGQVNNLISDAYDYKENNITDIIMSFRDSYRGTQDYVFGYFSISKKKFLFKSNTDVKLMTDAMLLFEIYNINIPNKCLSKEFKTFLYNGKLTDNVFEYLSNLLITYIDKEIDLYTEVQFSDNFEYTTEFMNKRISVIDLIGYKPEYLIFFYNDIINLGVSDYKEILDSITLINLNSINCFNPNYSFERQYSFDLICKKLIEVCSLNSEISLFSLVFLIKYSRHINININSNKIKYINEIITNNFNNLLLFLQDTNNSDLFKNMLIELVSLENCIYLFNNKYDIFAKTLVDFRDYKSHRNIIKNSRNIYINDLFKLCNNFKNKNLELSSNFLELLYNNNQSLFIKDKNILIKYLEDFYKINNNKYILNILNVLYKSNDMIDSFDRIPEHNLIINFSI